ncbi:adenylate kinase [Phytophthora boehmeriae]|uniref:Adenylate kinase n=1 Tax=Phytophthora boehmeriae TaxID=109152 RepID=A0A8T1X7E1_9STRA|nr:adenylate kinase [Phytophthora boehmeriae]
MRRHYLFTEDEKERSVGKGKVNLLKLWHSRRDAMLEGDTNAIGGEENAVVARELTMMWDLAKPMTSIMLSRDGYIGFFARAAKALVLPLTSDAAAIAVAQRDWEYDLEGVGSVGEPTAKGVSSSDNEMMAPEQFREALMQLADLVLPVESTANVFATFLRELRSSIAGVDTAISSTEPEPKFNDPVDRLVLRPLSCIPKIGNDAFLQKIPPSSDALRTIHGLQPPDSREMSLKQLLLSYNPRKYSLTRAFPHKKQSNSIDENTNNTEEIKTNATDDAKPFVEDEVTAAQQLHSELLGRLYSVRELATLKAGSLEELVAKGFADFLLPEKKSEAEAEVVRGLSISNASEGTEHGFEDQETDKPEATEDEGGDDTPPPEDSLVPPPEPTSAERNEIEPPSEPTVSFGTIFLTKFAQRYRGYVTRVQLAAEALKAQLGKLDAFSGWMLTDLPLTSDVAGALLEHGCVPDMILLMDEELIAAKEEEGVVNPLAALRRQQFQTEKAGIEDITQALGGTTRVISCPLFNQPTETLAAIERELNPLAPRLDSDEDGHVPQMVDEFDPAVIFAAPNPSDDEENEGKLGSPFQQDGDDIPDPEVVAAAKAIRKKSQQLQGETGRFCPVAWRTRGALIPGLPSNVCSFRQKFYAFAGEQEQRAFERNPAAYIPSGPCATTNFVPCVLLLGVRGSGLSRIADAIAQPDTVDGYPVEYVNLDMSLVERDAERLQQLEELKSEDARMTPEELFISALQTELKKLQPNPGMNVAHIIAGLDPEPSRIPSASTLGMCFKYEVFPVLVIPLVISEEEAVEALLQQWSENLPAPRRKLALTRTKEKDGEDGDAPEKEGDEDEEPPIDLEAAREDESVRLHEQFAEDQKTLDEAISTLRSRGVRAEKRFLKAVTW